MQIINDLCSSVQYYQDEIKIPMEILFIMRCINYGHNMAKLVYYYRLYLDEKLAVAGLQMGIYSKTNSTMARSSKIR